MRLWCFHCMDLFLQLSPRALTKIFLRAWNFMQHFNSTFIIMEKAEIEIIDVSF